MQAAIEANDNHNTLMLQGSDYTVYVSFLEIYNEELIDLLGADSTENPKLNIYEDSSKKVELHNLAVMLL